MESVTMAIIGTASAVIGLGYYFFKGAPPAENVYKNSQKVIQALEPLADHPYAAPIHTDMLNIMNMAKQVYEVKTQTSPIHSVDEAVSAAQQTDEKKKIEISHKILTNYMTQLIKIKEAMPKWINAISSTIKEDTEERSEWGAKFHSLMSGITSSPEELLIYALEGKSDIMAKVKQFMPGVEQQGDKQGGLLESINVELSNFSKAVGIAKDNASEISNSLKQKEIASPEVVKTDGIKQTSNDVPMASNEPKKPSMSDLNQELFNQMGIAAAASVLNRIK